MTTPARAVASKLFRRCLRTSASTQQQPAVATATATATTAVRMSQPQRQQQPLPNVRLRATPPPPSLSSSSRVLDQRLEQMIMQSNEEQNGYERAAAYLASAHDTQPSADTCHRIVYRLLDEKRMYHVDMMRTLVMWLKAMISRGIVVDAQLWNDGLQRMFEKNSTTTYDQAFLELYVTTTTTTTTTTAHVTDNEDAAAAGAGNPFLDLYYEQLARTGNVEMMMWCYELMNTHGQSLSKRGYDALIAMYASPRVEHREPARALRYFKEMRERLGAQAVDAVTYNIMIEACVHDGLTNLALRLVQQMQRNDIRMSIETVVPILKWYVAEEEYPSALEWYNQTMRPRKLFPRVVDTYTPLLEYCAYNGRVLDVMNVMADIKEAKLIVMPLTYRMALTAMSESNECTPHQCLEVVNDMTEAGVRVDTIIYNKILQAYLTQGDADGCARAFDDMPNYGLQPDAISYMRVMQSYLHANNPQGVSRYFRALNTAAAAAAANTAGELKVTELHYNMVISAHGNHGMIQAAFQYYRDMKRAGVQPTIRTYMALLRAADTAEDVDFANTLYARMTKDGVQPDLHFFTAVLDLNGRQRGADAAKTWFEIMRKHTGVEAPDRATYNALIRACGVSGQRVEALRFYSEMLGHQIKPNRWTQKVIDMLKQQSPPSSINAANTATRFHGTHAKAAPMLGRINKWHRARMQRWHETKSASEYNLEGGPEQRPRRHLEGTPFSKLLSGWHRITPVVAVSAATTPPHTNNRKENAFDTMFRPTYKNNNKKNQQQQQGVEVEVDEDFDVDDNEAVNKAL